ncbi:NADP-dependent oxidoreductase [Microbacterium immunditiarum]|uniref:NADPH:quinone reductase-like Zn-dependent oxidoreductase n=1 Tax=Microbacterium immunditiarum TaxID=337480 RepID=A0A7Y9GP22_9MICO|nr:NADP-dependent oxidoreductase [Microbacterium immunditiarum]NYE20073.1 NADPH:quinone reductase-like Zn-dependent oxidoreductase [Microbacterium immunditiarum]
MKAITVAEQGIGVEAMTYGDVDYPHAAENDVIVRVQAAGFTTGELTWPGTWTDRAGRDRTPSIPGHELAGVVHELGYGTTGLTVGQRVFGLTDWTRNGSLAEYTAVEARNLAPLPANVSYVDGAALAISGLTSWQGLFQHGRLEAGQVAIIHGAAGAVGSTAVQLAHQAGARVIGTGRAGDRAAVLEMGAHEFVDLQSDELEKVGEADLVFDVLGGEIFQRSLSVLRDGGRIVTIPAPPPRQPENGIALYFVVEPNRPELAELARQVQEGRLRPRVGAVRPLAEAAAAFAPGKGGRGKTIITVG